MFEDLYTEEDENDVDEFGMDPHTRRRLRVKSKGQMKGKKKPMRPMRTRMPYSLAKVPKLGGVDEMKLRSRAYISEAKGGWEAVGEGDHPSSFNEKAARPFLTSLAEKVISSLDARLYSKGIKKSYIEGKKLIVSGAGKDGSGKAVSWSFEVYCNDYDTMLKTKYRKAGMLTPNNDYRSASNAADPSPMVERAVATLNGIGGE